MRNNIVVTGLIAFCLLCIGATAQVARAAVPNNPGTPSGYIAVPDESTGELALCWYGAEQFAGIGNCMPVVDVMQIMLDAQAALQAADGDSI